MQVSLEDLMEKLGVGRVLTPYETQPWMCYDEDRAITCSAEVRMGPNGDDIELEVQFLYDNPEDIEDEDESGEGDAGGASVGPNGEPVEKPRRYIFDGRAQIMLMKMVPNGPDKEWTGTFLYVKGRNYKNKFFGWEEKGCDFFRAVIEAVLMNELPEIEDLIESTLVDTSQSGRGRRGRVGRKSPKVKPGQLLGMKK